MALQSRTTAVGNLQDDTSGNNYSVNKAFYVLKLDKTLAQIYSAVDSSFNGTTPIIQDGVNNVTNSRGEFTYWVEAGDYIERVGANERRVSITGADYFNNRIEETENAIIDAVAGRGAYYPVGSFEAGFTYTDINQVGTFGTAPNRTYYVYAGGFTNLPHTVPAGTDPTLSDDYENVFYTDHNNLTNRNTVDAHDADAISLQQGGSVQDYINENLTPFETVADMRSYDYSSVDSGSRVEWQGYYSQSDGGSNWGVLRKGDSASLTDDGGSVFVIDANTYILANMAGKINIRKWGANPSVIDNKTQIETALNSGYKNFFGSGVFSVSSEIEVIEDDVYLDAKRMTLTTSIENCFLLKLTGNNIKVDCLSCDGGNLAARGVTIAGDDCELVKPVFKDMYSTSLACIAIHVTTPNRCKITKAEFYNIGSVTTGTNGESTGSSRAVFVEYAGARLGACEIDGGYSEWVYGREGDAIQVLCFSGGNYFDGMTKIKDFEIKYCTRRGVKIQASNVSIDGVKYTHADDELTTDNFQAAVENIGGDDVEIVNCNLDGRGQSAVRSASVKTKNLTVKNNKLKTSFHNSGDAGWGSRGFTSCLDIYAEGAELSGNTCSDGYRSANIVGSSLVVEYNVFKEFTGEGTPIYLFNLQNSTVSKNKLLSDDGIILNTMIYVNGFDGGSIECNKVLSYSEIKTSAITVVGGSITNGVVNANLTRSNNKTFVGSGTNTIIDGNFNIGSGGTGDI